MKKEGAITLFFFAIIAVLVVTHATGFASAVTAVGGQTYNETSLLTGAPSANQNTAGTVTAGGKGGAGSYSLKGVG